MMRRTSSARECSMCSFCTNTAPVLTHRGARTAEGFMPEVQKMQQISTSLRERETEKNNNKKKKYKKAAFSTPYSKITRQIAGSLCVVRCAVQRICCTNPAFKKKRSSVLNHKAQIGWRRETRRHPPFPLRTAENLSPSYERRIPRLM